jgi:hypothetical protein
MTDRAALFLLTVGTEAAHVENLLATLEGCRSLLGGAQPESKKPDVQGQVVMPPRDAHYANGHYMTLSEIAGCIRNGEVVVGCQMVTPYPPGIPTILPGLPIAASVIDWISELVENEREVHGLHVIDGAARIRVLRKADDEFKRLTAQFMTQPKVSAVITALHQQVNIH